MGEGQGEANMLARLHRPPRHHSQDRGVARTDPWLQAGLRAHEGRGLRRRLPAPAVQWPMPSLNSFTVAGAAPGLSAITS